MGMIYSVFCHQPIWLVEIMLGIWEIFRVVIAFGIILYVYGIFKAIKVARRKYERVKRGNSLHDGNINSADNEKKQPATDTSKKEW